MNMEEIICCYRPRLAKTPNGEVMVIIPDAGTVRRDGMLKELTLRKAEIAEVLEGKNPHPLPPGNAIRH